MFGKPHHGPVRDHQHARVVDHCAHDLNAYGQADCRLTQRNRTAGRSEQAPEFIETGGAGARLEPRRPTAPWNMLDGENILNPQKNAVKLARR